MREGFEGDIAQDSVQGNGPEGGEADGARGDEGRERSAARPSERIRTEHRHYERERDHQQRIIAERGREISVEEAVQGAGRAAARAVEAGEHEDRARWYISAGERGVTQQEQSCAQGTPTCQSRPLYRLACQYSRQSPSCSYLCFDLHDQGKGRALHELYRARPRC
jgi:hypothetical protein